MMNDTIVNVELLDRDLRSRDAEIATLERELRALKKERQRAKLKEAMKSPRGAREAQGGDESPRGAREANAARQAALAIKDARDGAPKQSRRKASVADVPRRPSLAEMLLGSS